MNGEEQHILQKHLARFLIQEVFNTVSKDELLRIERNNNPIKPDIWHYKGNRLQSAQIELLKKQASSFKESELWNILRNELRWHAEQKGLVSSKTEADQIAAKLLIYITDVIDSKLGDMSK